MGGVFRDQLLLCITAFRPLGLPRGQATLRGGCSGGRRSTRVERCVHALNTSSCGKEAPPAFSSTKHVLTQNQLHPRPGRRLIHGILQAYAGSKKDDKRRPTPPQASCRTLNNTTHPHPKFAEPKITWNAITNPWRPVSNTGTKVSVCDLLVAFQTCTTTDSRQRETGDHAASRGPKQAGRATSSPSTAPRGCCQIPTTPGARSGTRGRARRPGSARSSPATARAGAAWPPRNSTPPARTRPPSDTSVTKKNKKMVYITVCLHGMPI